MLGPGKYDHYATKIREETKAQGVILIVLTDDGPGFSAQCTPEIMSELPMMMLRLSVEIGEDMRRDMRDLLKMGPDEAERQGFITTIQREADNE